MTRDRRARALSWALALGALAFVAWSVKLRDFCPNPEGSPCDRCLTPCQPGLLSTLGHVGPALLGVLFLVNVLGTVAWAARWKRLLRLALMTISLRDVWRIILEAQSAAILLPGGVGGDALRILALRKRAAKTAVLIGSVVLERGIGLVTLAGVAVASSLLLGGGGLSATLVLATIPVGFAIVLLLLRSAAIGRASWMNEGRWGHRFRPLVDYINDDDAPRAIAGALGWSVLLSVVQFVVIRGLILALGISPSGERWVLVATAMAMIVSAIPALPGSWGTSEAAYVFFLGRAGVSPTEALAVCLLYRLLWYATAGLGGVSLFFRSTKEARQEL